MASVSLRVRDCSLDWVANDFPLHQAVGHVDPNVGSFLEEIIPDKLPTNSMHFGIPSSWRAWAIGVRIFDSGGHGGDSAFGGMVLVALTSPVTRRWREKHGWKLRSDLGKDGYFVYPKESLPPATIEHFMHPDFEGDVDPVVRELMKSFVNVRRASPCACSWSQRTIAFRLNLTM